MREASSTVAGYNWPSDKTVECPYPFYEALREDAPVYELPAGRFAIPHLSGRRTFLISRWEDVAAIAQQPERFEVIDDPYTHISVDVDFPTVDRYVPTPSPHANGADHKVKRAWSLRIVEPARMRAYEPIIVRIAHELIDGFAGRGECDFRWDFGEKLPIYLICHILGLPREDAPFFQEISDEKLKGYLEASLKGETKGQKTSRIHPYMLNALKERLAKRTDDLLSELMYEQIEKDGAVDINFQMAQGINLIIAGAETTAHMLTNMMSLLVQDAAMMQRVTGDWSLIPGLVEESLRLESPVQWLARICMEDTVVNGTLVPKDAAVILMWASGNRDPRKFANPDAVDLERAGCAKNQLGFGRGAHLCAGAALARLEGKLGFEAVFSRLRGIRLVPEKSDLSNVRTYHGRGPKKLYVAFEQVPATVSPA